MHNTAPGSELHSGPHALPNTLQDAVSSGGPLLALLGFCLLPLIWSVPEALVTAELATAFPEVNARLHLGSASRLWRS